MSVSHVYCGVSWGKEPGSLTWRGDRYNQLVSLPHEGFNAGDRIIRYDNPFVGILEHICVEEINERRRFFYAYVLWPNLMRRGDDTFDTQWHHYMRNIRHATPEHVATAEAIVAEKLYRVQMRLNLLSPRD